MLSVWEHTAVINGRGKWTPGEELCKNTVKPIHSVLSNLHSTDVILVVGSEMIQLFQNNSFCIIPFPRIL